LLLPLPLPSHSYLCVYLGSQFAFIKQSVPETRKGKPRDLQPAHTTPFFEELISEAISIEEERLTHWVHTPAACRLRFCEI
jgi:hypothetical protein